MVIFNIFIIVAPDDKPWGSWAIEFFEFQEEGMTEQFKLWIALMIIGNFIITYVTEKFGIWYLSVWWKNRQDRKRQRERELEIEEEERTMGFTQSTNPSKKLLTNGTKGDAQNVYLPQIDEGEMGSQA